MFYINQISSHDCGYTCIKILLANLNKNESYLYIDMPLDNHNASLAELVNYGKKYNLDLIGAKISDTHELKLMNNYPILLIKNTHMYYVYKINKKYIYYIDPEVGKMKAKKSIFLADWEGVFIYLKSFSEMKLEKRKPKLIKYKEEASIIIMQMIITISLMSGVYFISKDMKFYYPLLFFIIMIIMELLLKKYSLNILHNIDHRIELPNKDYYSYYQDKENYKKYLFVNNVSFISNLFNILLISVLLIANYTYNFIYVIVDLFIAVLAILIASKYLYPKEIEMNKIEYSLNRQKDKILASQEMSTLSDLASKYGNIALIIKFIAFTSIFINVFTMMIVNNIINITYIICYFSLSYFLYQNIIEALNYPNNKRKQDYALLKMINIAKE